MDIFGDNSRLVNDDGRVSFTGLGGNIDFRQAIDSIIEARRFPIDRLETRVSENTTQLSVLREMQGLVGGVQDAVENLRGAFSIGNENDLFAAKQAFASSVSLTGTTASPAGDILAANVTNAAQTGVRQVEVLQRAEAQRIASGEFADETTALNIAGTFSINGTDINVQTTDTLLDVRARINNANSGDTATGVSASIISPSETENLLILNADDTGEEIALNDPDGVLESLGFLTAGGDLANELRAAQNAQLKVDGLQDTSTFISAGVTDATQPLDTFVSTSTGTLTLTDADGVAVNVAFDTSVDSMQDLAARINTDAGAIASAQVVEEDGVSRLEITSQDGRRLDITDTGTLTDELGFARPDRIVERSSNRIDDLFDGITLDILKAEPGTQVDIEVDRNLTSVRDSILDFVDAFNELKQFTNAQRFELELEGMEEGEVGILRGTSALRDVETNLNRVLGQGATGVDSAFSVLSQIGIDLVERDSVANPSLRNTLEVDGAQLSEALLNNFDEVRSLFSFRSTTSSTDITVIGFDGNTRHNGTGDFTLTVDADAAGNVLSAEIDGVAAQIDGNRIIGQAGNGAEGIRILYDGGAATGRTIDFNVTNGIASNTFFATETLLADRGSIDGEIRRLETQNEDTQTRIDRQLEQLDFQRERLIERFAETERRLGELNSVRSSLDALMASLTQNN